MAHFYTWNVFTRPPGSRLIAAFLGSAKVDAARVSPLSDYRRRLATRAGARPQRRQRLCRLEPLEGRALLTGGLILGDYLLEPTAQSSELAASEVWLRTAGTGGNIELLLQQHSGRGEPADRSGAAGVSENESRTKQESSFPSSFEQPPFSIGGENRIGRDSDRGHRESADGDWAVDDEQGSERDYEKPLDESVPGSDETKQAPGDDEGKSDFNVGSHDDPPADFTPRGDGSEGMPLPEPAAANDSPTDPIESQRNAWQTTARVGVDNTAPATAGTGEQRGAIADPGFHYFVPAQTTADAPSLAAEPLGRHAAHDTYTGLALLSPTTQPAMADNSSALIDSSQDQVAAIPVSRVMAAATAPAVVSQATLARAQQVVRSVDAALAELGTEDLPPARDPQPDRGTRGSGTTAAVPSDSCEEQAVADNNTLRLGFFALGSLVLGSRWTPRASSLLVSRILSKRDLWLALLTRRRGGRPG